MGIGKMIDSTDWANILILKEIAMKEDGKMISNMDSEFKNGLMAVTMKDNTIWEKGTV